MDSHELIGALGAKLGLDLALEDGACALEADGFRVTIHDLPELEAIALVGDAGEPPPERLEGLYRAMLESNHLFRDTAGATLSVDPATGRVSLCRMVPCRLLDGDGFVAVAEQFVNTLEVWARIVREYRDVAAAATAAGPEEAPPDGAFGAAGIRV